MILKILLGLWMTAVIVAAYAFVSPTPGFTAGHIIFFHVPNAMVAAMAFLVSTVYGIRYLGRRNLMDDAKSGISAELGLLFAVLATVTGSLFARIEWHSWWNWDPRETSIVILLLVYAAYFALRTAVDSPEKRAQLSAVYAILALPAMAFLMFVVPRIMASLHPADTLAKSGNLGLEHRLVLYPAMIGFLGLYIWLFRIRTTMAEVRLKLRR